MVSLAAVTRGRVLSNSGSVIGSPTEKSLHCW